MHDPTVSRPLAPLYRVFLFGRLRLARRDPQGQYHPLPPDTWDRQSPRRVLTYLLLAPGRHTLKDPLLDALCPDDDLDRAQAILSQALSLIRHVLVDEQGYPLLLPRKATPQKPLILAGREWIWCDWDAFQDTLMQAQAAEQQGKEALPVWEQAYALCQEEFLLEERYNDWCREVRERAEGDQRLCLLHLAACYEQQGRSVDAERILRAWLSAHALDQDVLCRLMEVLVEQGRVQEALTWYKRTCAVLEEEGEELARRTQETMEWVRALPIQRKPAIIESAREYTNVPLASALPSGFPYSATQGIIETARVPEEDSMDQHRRRFLQQALKGTGVALLTSQDLVLGSEIAERLAKALARPSCIDDKTLNYLEARIEHYWQDRNNVVLPVRDLLLYVLEDLRGMIRLLEGSLPPTARTHLCSIAGAAAMLIGELHYDMRNYAQSRIFQELAIVAAYEANDAALEAVAWGRNSFAWTYDGNPIEARNSIQQARRLAGSVNSTIRTWLAAVEAEIQSNLSDRKACLKTLKEAAPIEDGRYHPCDCYWIHFDQSLLAGYQGISFLKLSQAGHEDLVSNAQDALQNALSLLDPSMKRRQPTLFVDLAGTYIQQKNIEQACGYATQAITMALQINSKVLLQRLLTLRSNLKLWEETRYVQDLDRCIEPLLLP